MRMRLLVNAIMKYIFNVKNDRNLIRKNLKKKKVLPGTYPFKNKNLHVHLKLHKVALQFLTRYTFSEYALEKYV